MLLFSVSFSPLSFSWKAKRFQNASKNASHLFFGFQERGFVHCCDLQMLAEVTCTTSCHKCPVRIEIVPCSMYQCSGRAGGQLNRYWIVGKGCLCRDVCDGAGNKRYWEVCELLKQLAINVEVIKSTLSSAPVESRRPSLNIFHTRASAFCF